MKNIIVLLSIVILLVCNSFVTAQNDNPQRDLYSFDILFSRVPDGTMTNSVPVYTFKDSVSIKMKWPLVPGVADYSQQAEPLAYAGTVDFFNVPLLNADVSYSDGIPNVLYVSRKLYQGEWQVQVRCSLKASDGSLLWSKYSDAAYFKLLKKEEAPNRPVTVEIIFK